MTAEETSRGRGKFHALMTRLYHWHLAAYCVLMGALLVVNIFVGGGWWSFWPMCVWGLLLAFHFFYYKAVTVDDRWVQERTEDLSLRSYDLGHIRDIKDRVESEDPSVRPPSERNV
ncbi:MAG: hypothetical protein GTO67_11235 [Gammaproteobacteria bacterium]|nr:hypothetical protein [Gammaproteobacteria bacterium]NIM72265.1 hypothetical protein [Gammaproteobacteria bacterium]NIN39180.1 hypothetical protein [Gammaproteobacteria bacterium]NIO24013.1 hypothetical protein [Gammaproteobacteria bacterium]NIO64665.1 hypothetical protein [Gammaproteobacteria bacterium]